MIRTIITVSGDLNRIRGTRRKKTPSEKVFVLDKMLKSSWGSDDDSSCDEWNTYEMGEQNYDDDEDQTIMVIRYSDYLKMSGKSS